MHACMHASQSIMQGLFCWHSWSTCSSLSRQLNTTCMHAKPLLTCFPTSQLFSHWLALPPNAAASVDWKTSIHPNCLQDCSILLQMLLRITLPMLDQNWTLFQDCLRSLPCGCALKRSCCGCALSPLVVLTESSSACLLANIMLRSAGNPLGLGEESSGSSEA